MSDLYLLARIVMDLPKAHGTNINMSWEQLPKQDSPFEACVRDIERQ